MKNEEMRIKEDFMKKNKFFSYKLIIHLIFILLCASFLIPFLYVISLSVTSEDIITGQGYKLIPAELDFSAYKWIFANPSQLIASYRTTILFSCVGTALSMVFMTTIAYAISRRQFAARRAVTFFVYFTMLFSGGMVPSYMINTKYLGLTDSFWVYILPSLASAYHILILRTFFQGIPSSLMEAAKIDGASEMRIFRIIALPLSKPVLATVALLTLLNKWNDWQTSLLYINEEKLYSLQYLLQKILRETEFLEQMSKDINLNVTLAKDSSPIESMRFAMAILAAGPMMVIFPFFQKYFTRGLTIGAVKG